MVHPTWCTYQVWTPFSVIHFTEIEKHIVSTLFRWCHQIKDHDSNFFLTTSIQNWFSIPVSSLNYSLLDTKETCNSSSLSQEYLWAENKVYLTKSHADISLTRKPCGPDICCCPFVSFLVPQTNLKICWRIFRVHRFAPGTLVVRNHLGDIILEFSQK